MRLLFKIIMLSGLCLILEPPAWTQAQDNTLVDSSTVAPNNVRVKYRSTGETLATIPGRIIILPFEGVFFVMEHTASLIWEKRLIDRLNTWFTTASGRAGIQPLANTTSGPGVRFFHLNGPLNADVNFTTQWGVSLRQDHKFSMLWPDNRLVPGDLAFEGQFRRRSVEKYYGIGNSTPRTAGSDFLQEDANLRMVYQRRFNRTFTVGSDLGYRSVDIRSGKDSRLPNTTDVFSSADAPGLSNRANFITTSAFTQLRFVDVPGSPTRGNQSLLRFGYHQSIDDENFSHFRLAAVTEQFLELFHRRVLSVRVGTDWRTAPIGSNEVPFYSLASLGGEQVLRGFERGRFRDRGATFATATYKFPILDAWDGFIFYERGSTFNHPNDFTLKNWKNTFGGGFHIWRPEGTVFDLLVARSNEQVRVVFNFNTGL